MTNQAKKLLALIFIIITALFITVTLTWLLFLNKAEISFIAEPPFAIRMNNEAPLNCEKSPCTMYGSPGTQFFTLTKNGFESQVFTLNLIFGKPLSIPVDFKYIPTLDQLGKNTDLTIFPPPISFVANNPQKYFAQDGYLAWLETDENQNRQNLMLYELSATGDITEPKGENITSFLRRMKNHRIIPIPSQNLILIIDITDEKSELYLVDLKQKKRENLLTFKFIKNVFWLSKDDYILQGRAKDDIIETLYYVKNGDSPRKFELQTTLENLATIDQHTFFAATLQDIEFPQNQTSLPDIPVTLTNQITENQVNILKYNTTENTFTFVKTLDFPNLPNAIKLNETKNGLYLKFNDDVYQLRLTS